MFWGKMSKIALNVFCAGVNSALLVHLDVLEEPFRYLHAVANPGLITFTGPYLDVGGAGYVVTISHTVHSSSAQMSSGHSVAVMGIDFTLRYFYKVLMDLLPVCNQDGGNKIRCFIMEDRGYLVAHPTLIDPKGHAPVEQQHITHKGDLTNLVHGSHCSKYRLTRIPGTNAFVGIVNETCDSLAFCACSMVDRLCLNCHRMEQNECECPCECPLEVNECTGNLTNAESRNPSCEVHQEPMTFTAIDPSLQDALPQCINTQCNQRTEKMSVRMSNLDNDRDERDDDSHEDRGIRYSTMSPQEDSENPPGTNEPLAAGVDVGAHDEELELDTPPQTAALLSHKFQHYRLHHPALGQHSHHLQAAVTVHSADAEC
ncbi:hypothetical protein WISP_54300 [Willisornis vidua]|uniref:Uncharacterized protein n=1 Tax=Willisornis vidua TaxID=1566151 RepID=A0ABQ9DCP1_9PASS|nr:hypothetical protein WISP_54300 [Willisornis vidua]